MTILDEKLLADPLKLKKAGQYANPESGGEVLPLVYGDLTSPAVAEGIYPLPQIDTVNRIYALAGHAVLAVADGNVITLYDDDGLIPSNEYTITTNGNLEGQGAIAYVTFSVAPKGSVRARLKGKADGATLIQNPVSVAEDLALLAGLASSFFDAPSLEAARAFASSQGYQAAGVFTAERPLGEMMQQVLGDFLGHFRVDGRRKLRFFLDAKGAPQAERLLAGGLAERDGMEIELSSLREDIVNQVPVDYAHDWHGGRYLSHQDGESTKDGTSQSLHGLRLPREGSFNFRWVRDATSVGKLQEILITRFGGGVTLWEFHDSTLKTVAAEVGDYLRGSLSWAYEQRSLASGGKLRPLRNQILRVLAKEVDLARGDIHFTLLDTGTFLTRAYLADGSQTADGSVLAGSERDVRVYE